MKIKYLIFGLLALSSFSLTRAEQIVNVGTTFTCYFQDYGESGRFMYDASIATWNQSQMDAAIRALATWDAIIENTPGRTLNVGLYWGSYANGTLAGASSHFLPSYTSTFEKTNTIAEEVWRNGSTYNDDADFFYDIYIICNTNANFYYGEAPLTGNSNQYDFQSVLFHEIGHAVGFNSQLQSNGTFKTEYGSTLYTTFDSLITDGEGIKIVDKAANGQQAVSLGETLSLEGTTLTVFNPTTYQDGSSFAHIDPVSDPDAVMQSTITNDTSRRMLSEEEFLLMERMGWDMVSYSDVVPEPSTTTLTLFTLVALSLRRKRTA